MSKSSYLKVKYQIPHEYFSFTKSKTKHLNRYLLFKFIYSLLVEMYYSISCYKLLTRAIANKFNRNYKYIYIIRMFITDFLNYLGEYKSIASSYLASNTIFYCWNSNLNSSKSSIIGSSSYSLFVKFFLLLLQRRNAFASVLRKERTTLYHIRQISNYVFYEKHTRILSFVKQDILNFDLKKRIIDSIFNVSRYSRKRRFMNKRHIFHLVSFNMVLSSKRFDRLKKGRKSRSFYANKLKFKQLYKNMFNIRTTGIFKKYIKYVLSRLKRFVGISSIYFHQIYVFLLSYFFYYLDLFQGTRELHSLKLRINSTKYNISNFYYLLIGDKIEIGSAFLNYLLALRKLTIAFVLSQLFYSCSTILPIKLKRNKNKNYKIPGNKAIMSYISKYLCTGTFKTFDIKNNQDNVITTSLSQIIHTIQEKLRHYTCQINNTIHYRNTISSRKIYKKRKTNLFKKFSIQKSKYCLLGYVFDSIPNTIRSKIYILHSILGIYLHYSSISKLTTLYNNYNYTLWFKMLVPLSALHLQFITALSNHSNGIYFQLQLCTSKVSKLLEYLDNNHLFNVNSRINNSIYTQYFNFNKKLKCYFGFLDYENIRLSNVQSSNLRRIYSNSINNTITDLFKVMNNKENQYINTALFRQHHNSLFKLVRFTRKLTFVCIYKIIYYCLTKIVKLVSISKLSNTYINRAITNYCPDDMYAEFFPNLYNSYDHLKQDNLLRNVLTLLYIRRSILYNRKTTRFFFFRIRKRFKKKKKLLDKFRPSLKRGYNFSIIQNNDYFRRLGIYDFRSFVKKVFIDKTMPRYNSIQHNSYFKHDGSVPYKNERSSRNSKQQTAEHYGYRHRNQGIPNKSQYSQFVKFYHTNNIGIIGTHTNRKVTEVSKTDHVKGKIRVKLVSNDMYLNALSKLPMMYKDNNTSKFNKGTHRVNTRKTMYVTDQTVKSDFGNLVIATLHKMLIAHYLQSNKLYTYATKQNSKTVKLHRKQLARSIANDYIIDLYYLSTLNKQSNLIHSHDDLSYILKQTSNNRNKYSIIHMHIMCNIYLYLKYIKQWFNYYFLNMIHYLKNNNMVQQTSINLIHNLKVITEYNRVQLKFISATPLLYKIINNKLKFIIYNFNKLSYKSNNIIKTMPTNLRYLFLDKSSRMLASKFR